MEVKEKNLVHHAKQFKTSGGKKKYSLFKAKMNKVKFARNMVSDMMVGAALDVDTKAIKEGIADITDNTAEIQETDEFQEINDKTATEGVGEIEVVPDIDTSGAQVNIDTSGEIYIIENPLFEGWVKVGMAIDSKKRLKDYFTYTPQKNEESYKLIHTIEVKNRMVAESEIHNQLENECDRIKEWFQISSERAKEIVSGYGIDF